MVLSRDSFPSRTPSTSRVIASAMNITVNTVCSTLAPTARSAKKTGIATSAPMKTNPTRFMLSPPTGGVPIPLSCARPM